MYRNENIDLGKPDEVMTIVQGITQNSLNSVLARRHSNLDYRDTIQEITQQVVSEIFSGEVDNSMQSIRTRIKSLCFREATHFNQVFTNQDLINDEGKVTPFEGAREGIDDMREEFADMTSGVLGDRKMEDENERPQRILQHYEDFVQELHGVYTILGDDFLQEFFVQRFIEGRSYQELAKVVEDRVKGQSEEGISVIRVGQIEQLIFRKVRQTTGISIKKIETLLSQGSLALRKLLDNGDKKSSQEQRDLFFDIGRDASDFNNFAGLKLDELAGLSSSERVITLPELLPESIARRRRNEAILRLEENLELLYKRPEIFCQGKPQNLFPHQYEKLAIITDHLKRQFLDGTPEKFLLADIAPPSAGKTYVQAALAKLSGLPFVFVTHSNAILTGSDGAIRGFEKLFSRDELGIVNVAHKEFGRRGTLTTYHSFTIPNTLEEIMIRPAEEVPLLFLLDEGDLAQTDIRSSTIRAVKGAVKCPIILAFSATRKSGKRDLGEMAEIVHEMELKELIQCGKAKHILGFYVNGKITVFNQNLRKKSGEKHVVFETLQMKEKTTFTQIPVEIAIENHQGQQGIIHCMSVEHAREVAQLLQEKNINGKCISGECHTAQNKLKDQYVKGEVQVLTSCDFLGRGYSEHGVTQFVIFAAVTSSKTELYHKVGRGFRPNKDHPVLAVYQLLPMAIEDRSFLPTYLSDIFDPKDFSSEKFPFEREKTTIRDKIEMMNQLIREGRFGFVGGVGQEVEPSAFLEFFTQKEIEKIIDTRKRWLCERKGTLKLTADNIDGLFRPIADKFVSAGGEEDNLDWINSNRRFVDMTVEIGNDAITGQRFIAHIVAILARIGLTEAGSYRKFGVELMKKWYLEGVRPSNEFVQQRLQEERALRRKRPKLRLSEENLDPYFMDIVAEFNRVRGEDTCDWMVVSPSFLQAEVEMRNRTISGNHFAANVVSILAKIPRSEGHRYVRFGIEIIKKWYMEAKRPDDAFIKMGLAAAEDQRREKRQKQEKRLKLNEGNIDDLFFPVVDRFAEELGGAKSDCEWINVGPIFFETNVVLNDQLISGRGLTRGVLSILAGINFLEANRFLYLAAELIRKWYVERKRPDEEFVRQKLEATRKAKDERDALPKLELTEESLEELFFDMVAGFNEARGENNCEWMAASPLFLEMEIEINSQTITGNRFVFSVLQILGRVNHRFVTGYLKFGVEVIKKWYNEGEKPSETFVREGLEKEKQQRADATPKLSLTTDNIDNFFRPIVDGFIEASGKAPGDCGWISMCSPFTTMTVSIDNHTISGRSFGCQVLGNLADITVLEASSYTGLSVELVKKWYEDGKRPDKEFVIEALAKARQAREAKNVSPKLALSAENIDDLFRPIMDGFIEVMEAGSGDCEWMSVGRPFMGKEIEIEGRTIKGQCFINNLTSILTDRKVAEVGRMLKLGIELAKKWYKEDKRPDRNFVEVVLLKTKKEQAAKRRSQENRLKLDNRNLDGLFMSLVDSFAEAIGQEKGDYEWISGKSKLDINLAMNGQNIRWLHFVDKTTQILTGLSATEAAVNKSLGLKLIKEWCRCGSRPNASFINGVLKEVRQVQERRRVTPRLKLTNENIDELFWPIVDIMVEECGIEDYTGLNTGKCHKCNCIPILGEEITGVNFVERVLMILTDISTQRDAHSFHALGIEFIKEWYRNGDRPSKEFIRTRLEVARREKLAVTG